MIYLRQRIGFFLIFVLITVTSGFSQSTKIIGKIVDSKTKEPIPFVNIAMKGIQVGTITDFYGNYKIETKLISDTIIFSYIGYKQVKRKVNRNQFQKIDVEMDPSSLELNEVVVAARKRDKDNDPAINLLKNIIDHKSQNNYAKLNSFQYEAYTKIQFDINNITDKFKDRKLLKPFNFIFDYVDTSVVNGKPFLPVFFIESLSDFYTRKFPPAEREIIKATKVSGVQNESIRQFMGNMYININIYDNYIDLFGKGFISPISNTGRVFYKYFLVDSAVIDGKWCYHMVFQPRNDQEYVFNGNFWVADSSFAIKKIEMRIDKFVNLNFINNLEVMQQFDEIADTIWMLTKDMIVVDFNVVEDPKNAIGFFGHKTTTYRGHIVNQDPQGPFFENPDNIKVMEDAGEKDNEFWEEVRHEELTEKEKQIYNMVDTIKNLPAFRTYYDIISAFITYYYVWGNFEFGPYFTTYSFNPIEGNRFRLGGRTSNKISTKIMPEAYLAYGTKDNKFKYGGNLLWLYDKNPRRGACIEYKNDMEQLGQSINAFREDNIMSSILRRTPNDKLNMVEEFKMTYEHEYSPGISNSVSFSQRKMSPLPELEKFDITLDNQNYLWNTIITSDVTLQTHVAYKEKFVMGEFERISLGTTYPIIDVYLTYGFKDVFNSDFEYQKLEVIIEDWFNIYPFGYSRYILNGGRIWGDLPFPLLKIHEGNQTYGFDQYSFNMMNYYEFVSDTYISLYYSHYFEGFFLNKIPLFKRLKWREVVWGKGVVGTTRNQNVEVMPFLENMYTFDNPNKFNQLKPYLEAGAGIENIFRLLRFDVVWRFSYLDHENVSPLGFRLSLQLKF